MDRFVRRTIGLVALFALLVSMAHSVWALRCMVDEGASTAVSVVPDGVPGQAHGAMDPAARHHAAIESDHAKADSTHQGSHHGAHPQAPGHECPHGQEGMVGGCAIATAVPTATVAIAAIPFGEQTLVVLSDTLPRILFGTDLFRPPRA